MKAWMSLMSRVCVEGEEEEAAKRDQSVLDQGTRLVEGVRRGFSMVGGGGGIFEGGGEKKSGMRRTGDIRIKRHPSLRPHRRIIRRLHIKRLLRKRIQSQQKIRIQIKSRRIRASVIQFLRVLE